MFHLVAWKINSLMFLMLIPGISAKCEVTPIHAERALATVRPPACGIGSIRNPHLYNDPGAVIPIPG
jgi:hypothetical protein